ncbi:MAG: hypothetical protein ACE5DK_11370, partial [Paracoccaceae bacterium]
ALQRSVFDHDPVGLAAYNKALNKATMSWISKMKEFGDPANMRGYLKERRSAVIDALSRKKKSAQDIASRTVDELKPGMTRKGSSIQARTKIESAAAAARAEEKRMWEAIPDETKVGTDALHRRFRELDAGLPSAQRSDMPEDAARLLGKGGELLGTKLEVHGLYSRMREVARQSAAAGNRNKARIAGEIADAAMDALDASAVGPAMRDAVAKSRQVNETFSQGTVGRTLARSRAGGPAVPEELTLQKALGAGGLAGDVAVRDIIRAAPDSTGSIEQYLRGRAVGETVKKGEINPQAANKFAGSNAEMLANFPAIPGDLKRALAAHSKVARMSGKGAGLLDPKKSVGAKVLAEMAGGEVASVFNDPRLVKRLADQVRRSPDAMKGLAQGIADHVMLKSRSGVSDAGEYIISGKKMLAFAKEHEASIRAGMGDAGYSRISTIAKTLAKVEEAGGALPDVGHTMQDLPSNILRYAAGVLGARGGAQLGAGTAGASLKTASSGSRLLTKFAEKLTPNNAVRLFRDATYDPELYKAILMTGKATEKAQRESVGILNAWLAGTAIGIEGGSE